MDNALVNRDARDIARVVRLSTFICSIQVLATRTSSLGCA
jgi:hypothetical protein